MINIYKKDIVEYFKADLANFKQIYKAVKVRKRGDFARKTYQKAPKHTIRVQPRFCSKITLTPDYPTIKFTLLDAFQEMGVKG